jgi:hypothetical protein
MELLNFTSWSLDDLRVGGADEKDLQACVQHPFALVVGDLNIIKNGSIYEINCLTCNLIACTSTCNKGSLSSKEYTIFSGTH